MVKAFFLGILSSLFFAVTFIVNRKIGTSGGHWLWTASLRFYCMLPMLAVIVVLRKKYRDLAQAMRGKLLAWMTWSIVGFGFFYTFLCVASLYGPSWMVAASWQITIVAGVLLTPLSRKEEQNKVVRNSIPRKQLIIAMLILAGVVLVQFKNVHAKFDGSDAVSLACILIAAFSYPLGNRKMMSVIPSSLGTIERVFGMTLCSMPLWILLSLIAAGGGIYPSKGQILQSLVVAASSGVIATILFFKATDLVKDDVRHIAIVESTQAGEVIFSLLGGLLLLDDAVPSLIAAVGILIIVLGIILNGVLSSGS